MWQFAFGLEMDRHCLRRRHDPAKPPFVKVSDEAAYTLHAEWSSQVCIVARSAGLAFVDLVQDINTCLTALGGQAHRAEAYSWLANHRNKLLFGTDDVDTQKWMAALVGQRKEVLISGGQSGAGDVYGDALGARVPSWSESWQDVVRPAEFAHAPTGVAYLHAGGAGRWVDFRG